jgi:cytochrome c oxidase assembly protein subunit 15
MKGPAGPGSLDDRALGGPRLTPQQSFATTSRLALATMGLMFGLIVVGSVVRSTGSGLACPDWPLCEGRLIPRFEVHVLLEWSHRLLALLVSLMLFTTVGWSLLQRAVRVRLGPLLGFAVLLLFTQVLLGALTVWKLLSPAVVSSHLAVALLLFSTLLTIAHVARAESDAGCAVAPAPRPAGLMPLFALATVLLYAQAVLGGVVSSSQAGLACPDWPACRGEWFPPLQGAVGLQMAHRYGAYLLSALLVVIVVRARGAALDPVVARVGSLLLALVVGQMALGVINILLGIRVWLSALHLANATAMLALSLAATYRLASSPAPRAARIAEATS